MKQKQRIFSQKVSQNSVRDHGGFGLNNRMSFCPNMDVPAFFSDIRTYFSNVVKILFVSRYTMKRNKSNWTTVGIVIQKDQVKQAGSRLLDLFVFLS